MLQRRRGQLERFGLGTWALIALAGSLLLALLGWAMGGAAGSSAAYGAGYGGMMPWGGMMGGWGWMGALAPVALLGMLLFWAAVILGLVALVRWTAELPMGQTERASGTMSDTDAVEIARRRYARGEISREEYQQIRNELAA